MSFNIDNDLNEPLLQNQPSPQQQQPSPQQYQWQPNQPHYISFPQQPGFVGSVRNPNYGKYADFILFYIYY